jgi:nucleotide-binding universal stress UspA family protein
MYKHILLPTDGSELAVKAERECITLAKAVGAKITAVHVIAHPRLPYSEGAVDEVLRKLENDYEDAAKTTAEEMLASLKSHARDAGVECASMVLVGSSPYREIVEYATSLKCDLIVMSSHGRRGLEALLLGSETIKVLTHCNIPVLVVR